MKFWLTPCSFYCCFVMGWLALFVAITTGAMAAFGAEAGLHCDQRLTLFAFRFFVSFPCWLITRWIREAVIHHPSNAFLWGSYLLERLFFLHVVYMPYFYFRAFQVPDALVATQSTLLIWRLAYSTSSASIVCGFWFLSMCVTPVLRGRRIHAWLLSGFIFLALLLWQRR